LYVKYKATQQFGLLNEGEMYEDEHGNMKQFEMYDNIAEFIETFELAKENKKKTKLKGLEKFLDEPIPVIEDIDIIHDENSPDK
jgi:D-mannonate dehydratase